jgi:hypothetical protein
MAFDHPTPRALATHLETLLGLGDEPPAPPIDEARFRAGLAALPLDVLREANLLEALTRLALRAHPAPATAAPAVEPEVLAQIADEDLLKLAFEATGGMK